MSINFILNKANIERFYWKKAHLKNSFGYTSSTLTNSAQLVYPKLSSRCAFFSKIFQYLLYLRWNWRSFLPLKLKKKLCWF